MSEGFPYTEVDGGKESTKRGGEGTPQEAEEKQDKKQFFQLGWCHVPRWGSDAAQLQRVMSLIYRVVQCAVCTSVRDSTKPWLNTACSHVIIHLGENFLLVLFNTRVS